MDCRPEGGGGTGEDEKGDSRRRKRDTGRRGKQALLGWTRSRMRKPHSLKVDRKKLNTLKGEGRERGV